MLIHQNLRGYTAGGGQEFGKIWASLKYFGTHFDNLGRIAKGFFSEDLIFGNSLISSRRKSVNFAKFGNKVPKIFGQIKNIFKQLR